MAHKTEHETEQGTGKHPHKSAEDPRPHTKESGSKTASHETHSSGKSHSSGDGGSSSSDDLKSREYTDKDGNVHHHTHTTGQHKK